MDEEVALLQDAAALEERPREWQIGRDAAILRELDEDKGADPEDGQPTVKGRPRAALQWAMQLSLSRASPLRIETAIHWLLMAGAGACAGAEGHLAHGSLGPGGPHSPRPRGGRLPVRRCPRRLGVFCRRPSTGLGPTNPVARTPGEPRMPGSGSR